MNDLDRTHTVAEVAGALKCSNWFVREQVKKGVVTPLRVGRHMRFTDDDVAQLTTALRPASPAPTRKRRRRRAA